MKGDYLQARFCDLCPLIQTAGARLGAVFTYLDIPRSTIQHPAILNQHAGIY